MQTQYAYYAVFVSDGQEHPDPQKEVSIYFPDLPGAFSCGDNFDDGARMARECLELRLLTLKDEGTPFPSPSDPNSIIIAPNESLHKIEVDIRDFTRVAVSGLENVFVPDSIKRRGGARKGAGRPKKSEEERATAPVWVYLTKEERATLDKLAKTSGKTKSAYLRDVILQEDQKLS